MYICYNVYTYEFNQENSATFASSQLLTEYVL